MTSTYTLQDTPELAERIQRDLDVIIETVRAGDPGLKSLVLTGGFARGEGMVLRGEPQNDYDLVAVRGWRRPRVPYARLREDLERRLKIHVDLAPVRAWRLRWVSGSIFWYETARRGRTIWGPDYLDRVHVRSLEAVDRREGLRLLVNRAAGLLLVTETQDPEARLLQAAKALLAAGDAHLLARGEFPPSQTERWHRFRALQDEGRLPPGLASIAPWLAWAYYYKVGTEPGPHRDPDEAWQAAARAVLAAVPAALSHAHLEDLRQYAHDDGLRDHLVYIRRAGRYPALRRLLLNPTGRVRMATLKLLESSLDGHVKTDDARRWLGKITKKQHDPLSDLDTLRQVTLQ